MYVSRRNRFCKRGHMEDEKLQITHYHMIWVVGDLNVDLGRPDGAT